MHRGGARSNIPVYRGHSVSRSAAELCQKKIRAFYPLVLYVPEISGLANTTITQIRTSACGALGRGSKMRRAAELELALKGGVKLPRSRSLTFDLYTVRVWLSWPSWRPWKKSGTKPLLEDDLRWTPKATGFHTPKGRILWEDADYYVVLANHRHVTSQQLPISQ
eukprot:3757293-Amphidinium_carterae.2